MKNYVSLKTRDLKQKDQLNSVISLILAIPIFIIYLFIRFPASTATRILILGLVDGAFYALIAIGFSIIFGVSKMFKLSIGGYFVLGAFTARWLFFATDVNATYVNDTHQYGSYDYHGNCN